MPLQKFFSNAINTFSLNPFLNARDKTWKWGRREIKKAYKLLLIHSFDKKTAQNIEIALLLAFSTKTSQFSETDMYSN